MASSVSRRAVSGGGPGVRLPDREVDQHMGVEPGHLADDAVVLTSHDTMEDRSSAAWLRGGSVSIPSSDPTHDSVSSKLAIRDPSSPPIPLMSTRTPAMIRHATRGVIPRTRFGSRRGGGRAGARLRVGRARRRARDRRRRHRRHARRTDSRHRAGLFFPMNPIPRCDVLNNFGGMSKTFGSGGHQGVDIGATLGQEVYAVEDGVLTRQLTDLPRRPGNAWILVGNSDTQYRYYHLSAFAARPRRREHGVHRASDRLRRRHRQRHARWLPPALRAAPGPTYKTPVDPVPLLAIPRNCTVYPKQ